MNSSARATCFGSSRVMMRTIRLVSMARMALLHVLPDTFFQLIHAFFCRGALREHGFMNVLGCVLSGSPDNDICSLLIPFQNRPRTDSELLANPGRYGYLSLSGDSGLRDCHDSILPR